MGFITTGKRSVPPYRPRKRPCKDPIQRRKPCQEISEQSDAQDPPQTSKSLEDLPINVLHYIFALAGPGNSLSLTSKFCNRVFKVEDAIDPCGAWLNSDLALSIIRLHYLIPLNIDDRVLSGENISKINSHVQDLLLMWQGRGNDIASLKTDAHYILVFNCLEILRLYLESFKAESHALDARMLQHRFVSKEFMDCFINKAVLLGGRHLQDASKLNPDVLIMSKEMCAQERVSRVRFLMFKTQEISYHLSSIKDRIIKDEINGPARDVKASSIENHTGEFCHGFELCEANIKAASSNSVYRFDEAKGGFVYANPSINLGTPFPTFFFENGDELLKRLPLLNKLREYGFFVSNIDGALNCLISFYEPSIRQGDDHTATKLRKLIENVTISDPTRRVRYSPYPITRLMTMYHEISNKEANKMSSGEVLCCLKHLIREFYEPHDFSDDQPLWECLRHLKNDTLAPILFELCKDSENGYRCIFK